MTVFDDRLSQRCLSVCVQKQMYTFWGLVYTLGTFAWHTFKVMWAVILWLHAASIHLQLKWYKILSKLVKISKDLWLNIGGRAHLFMAHCLYDFYLGMYYKSMCSYINTNLCHVLTTVSVKLFHWFCCLYCMFAAVHCWYEFSSDFMFSKLLVSICCFLYVCCLYQVIECVPCRAW